MWWKEKRTFSLLNSELSSLYHINGLHKFPILKCWAVGAKCWFWDKKYNWSHRCRSKQIFGGAKDFCPNFPKLARKVILWLLPTNVLSQRSWSHFFCVTSKKRSSFVFRKRWEPFFEVKQHWAPFLFGFLGISHRYFGIFPKFSGIVPGLSTNQNYWRCACPPCNPASH